MLGEMMSSEGETRTTNQNGEVSEMRRTVCADKSAPDVGSLAVWDPMTEDFTSTVFNSYKEPSAQELAGCIARDVGASSSPAAPTVPQTSNKSEDVRLYIKHIPLEMTQVGLKNLFSRAGEVVYCKIVPSRDPSLQTRIGFVGYNTVKEAECGIQKFDGFDLGQAVKLRVSLSLVKSVQERMGGWKKSGEASYMNGSPSISAAHIVNGASEEKCANVELTSSRTAEQSRDVSPESPIEHPTAPDSDAKTGPGQQISLKACTLCKKLGCKWCSVCKTPYCSQKCQRQDWPQHKKTCSKNTPTQQQVGTTDMTQSIIPGQPHTGTPEEDQIQRPENVKMYRTRDEQERTTDQEHSEACELQQAESSGEAGFLGISEDDVEIGDLDIAAQLLGLNISLGDSGEKHLQQMESDQAIPHENETSAFTNSVLESLTLVNEVPSNTVVEEEPAASVGCPLAGPEQSIVSCNSGHNRFYAKKLPYVSLPHSNTFDVAVTEVCSFGLLWSQLCEPEHIEQQLALRTRLQSEYNESVFENYVPCIGELCVAQFAFDNCWYRVVVDCVENNGMLHVTYIDFGNSEDIGVCRVRQIKEDFAHIPRQALKVALCGVTGTELLGGCSDAGLDFLRGRVLGVRCQARLMNKSGDVLFVDLFDPEGETLSSVLVSKGFAQYNISTEPQWPEQKANSQGLQSNVWHSETQISTAVGSHEPPVAHPVLCTQSPNEDSSHKPNHLSCSLDLPVTDSSQLNVGFVHDQAASDLPCGAPETAVECGATGLLFSQMASSSGLTDGTEVPCSSSPPVNGQPIFDQPASSIGSSDSAGLPVNEELLNSEPSSSVRLSPFVGPVPLSSPLSGSPPYGQDISPRVQATSLTNSFDSPEQSATRPPQVNGQPSHREPPSFTDSPHSSERLGVMSPPENSGLSPPDCPSAASPGSPPHSAQVLVNNAGHDSSGPRKQAISSGGRREKSFECIVNSVISPWEFFVQKTEPKLVGQLNTLVAAMNKYIRSSHRDPTSLGRPHDICAAQFGQDNVWYRAEVLQILQNGIRVRYIDFGNCEVVPLCRVCDLPARFQSPPRFSVACALSGVRRPKGCQEWSGEAISYFKSQVTQKEFLCTPVTKHGDVLLVELLDRGRHAVVADDMITRGFADPFVTAGHDGKQLLVEELVFEPAILSADLPVNKGKIDIILTEIVSPGLVYVQIAKNAPRLAELTVDLNNHYSSTSYPHWNVKEGQFYAALFAESGDWCRAFVETTTANGFFSVLYVDFGNVEILNGSQLRPLEERFFSLSFCALRCSLAHLTPIGTKEWSDKAKGFIKSRLKLFSRLSARLVAKGKNKLFVDIRDPSGAVSFSQTLVNNSLARHFVKEGREHSRRL